ncbi:hypothetical protein NLN90_13050 [Citrobacter portucalensis]|uniref:hypothetical protein n=1 Tax=Citrobacter portucalensis TaxID=1639133 RepID=UPI00226B5D29|nr:hypothetical protein [Citrobacter portucalensis]MCX9056961.1 hypothetical protein [Citrobacter portucalensis]
MTNEDIEKVLIEMARLSGHELSAEERLKIRIQVASSLAAKERHRQRMNSNTFTWKKPMRVKR